MDNERERFDIEPASPLESDKLVEIAQQAERRIDAVKKIKTMALRLTNYHDWTDQGGKPYLQVSGAEKIARLFGISWRFTTDKIQRLDEEGGHFSYQVSMEFVMSGASVEFQGSRSSKDPFFSKKHGKEIPPQEIDRTDVMKAAITNTIGNGITRLLGIRNLTWDDLKETGIDITKIGRVEYKNGSREESNKPQPKNPNAPASQKQIGAIHAMLSKIGITDDFAKHEKVSKLLGFDKVMETFTGLTMEEAGKVIDALGKELP